MRWITLISDFGLADPSAGRLKGAMLKQDPNLKFLDITHEIKPHDIVTAGWVLKNSYRDAPEGSVHVISVLNNYNNTHSYLAFEYQGYFFIGPNNGIFSLAFEKLPMDIYEYTDPAGNSFSVKEVLSHMVGHIITGKPLSELGPPVRNLIMRIQLQPVITRHMIRGSVIYIDRYGNVVVNITRDQFEKTRAGREFSIYMKRNDTIHRISDNYQEVAVGETLCLFNSGNYLEIAIHAGNAAGMLGLSVDETIQIDFFDDKI